MNDPSELPARIALDGIAIDDIRAGWYAEGSYVRRGVLLPASFARAIMPDTPRPISREDAVRVRDALTRVIEEI